MNQEISVEIWENNDWKHAVSSYNNKKQTSNGNNTFEAKQENILMRIRPYISAQVTIQDSLVTQLVLGVANPSPKFAKNLVGRLFRVSMGYSNIKDGKFLIKDFIIFTGLVIQPPYFTDGGQGTDQILYIPLAMGALPIVEQNKDVTINYQSGIAKLEDVLNAIFKSNKFSSIKNIVFYRDELKNHYMKSSGSINLGEWGFSQLQRHFQQTEDIWLSTDNNNILFVSTLEDMQNENYAKQSSKIGNNAGVIYNRSYTTTDSFHRNKGNDMTNRGYVSTFLKTKFAVIGLDNSLNIDLAFVLPNVIGKRYCVIQNIGINIQIYSSINQEIGGEKNPKNKAFYIVRQEIFFSTFGDSSHKLSLLANPLEDKNDSLNLNPMKGDDETSQ